MEAGKNVTGFLTLANTTLQPINALVKIEDDNAAVLGSHTIAVPPQGMATLDIQELLATPDTAGGIRVSYVGGPDALLINGGLEDVGVGFSADLPFAEPIRQPPQLTHVVTPQSIAELGLMTGPADPWMSFPDGTVFTPYSVLRNISNAPITATPTLWWMQGSAPASFQLPPIRLLPWQTYSLDVPSLLASAGLKNFSGSVNLVFDTQGQTGLLMAAGSVDQTDTYVFEVAPRGIEKSAGKNLSYWSTSNGDDTMVTIWNPADEAQTFIFRLIFAGGHYDDVMTLGPRATKMFDISEIIATSGSDPEGNIIPAGVQEGSAKILGLEAENQHVLLAVDSGVYNVRKATCNQTCTTCDGATAYSISLASFAVAVSGQTQERLIAQWNTGTQYDLTSQAYWNSSNTSVATVQAGLVQGVSGGDFTVTGAISNEPVYANDCSPYPSCPIYGGGSGSGSGTVPYITSISPSTIMIGSSSVQLTINGTGFGSSPTVNLPSGVTQSNLSATDSKITVTVSVAYSSTIGNNNISVTANGARSNTASILLNGAIEGIVQNDFQGQLPDGTPVRDVTYLVQNKDGSAAANIPIAENMTWSGWNCSQSEPNPPLITTACDGKSLTSSSGQFNDLWGWYVNYTPSGCGLNVTDHWQWCAPSGSGPNPGVTFMTLTGYIHTNATEINGYAIPPSNGMPKGTVIKP